jgi:2-polyprenyl-6-methoxyphenol hydroxylase-like FAD-dependent oxidoreductase
MRILISGAGIAGLTMAFWLRRYGHEPIIVEKARDVRTQGYMIDFGGTGWDVADRMGLIDALKKKQHLIDPIYYKNRDGRTTAQIALSTLYEAGNVEGKFMILDRRDIVQELYEAVCKDVEIRFSTSIHAICQSSSSVSVTFNDDTSETFDLLIGADGIHSNIRHLLFGREEFYSNHLGYRFAVFLTPSLNYDLEQAYQMYVEPGYQFGIFPFSKSEWMVFFIERIQEQHLPLYGERLNYLRKTIPPYQRLPAKILARLREDTPIFMDFVTQITLPTWSNNRAILIGDAAYCPTLISGQGASMAMAGAYFLAQGLHGQEEPQHALLQFERRLRPHIEKIHASARRFAPNFVPQSRLQIQGINWLLRLSKFPLAKKVIGKQFTVESIIDKHRLAQNLS